MIERTVVFSVIVPFYNGEKYIEQTLKSIFVQTFRDFEIIIVNDGSSDESLKSVKSIIKNNPAYKIIFISQKNRGLGAARNTAIKNASGEIISLLDQDDLWYPNKLQVVYDVFKNREEISLVCHNEDIIKNGKINGIHHYGPAIPDMFRRLLFKGNCLSPSAVSFRREVAEDVGFFSEDLKKEHFVEDYDYWLRIAKKGHKFYFIDRPLGGCRVHPSQFSGQSGIIMLERELWLVRKHYLRYCCRKAFDRFRIMMREAKIMFALLRRIIAGKMLKYMR